MLLCYCGRCEKGLIASIVCLITVTVFMWLAVQVNKLLLLFFFYTKTKMSFHESFEFMSKWFTLHELCQDNPNVDSQQVTPSSSGPLNENNIDLQPLFFFLCTIYFFSQSLKHSSVTGIRKGDLPSNHVYFCSCCKECGSICSQVGFGRNLNLWNIHIYCVLCFMQFVPLGCEMSLFQIDVDTFLVFALSVAANYGI